MPRYRLGRDNACATGAALATVAFERELIPACDDSVLLEGVGYADPHAAHMAWLCANGGAATQAACNRARALTVRSSNDADLLRSAAGAQSLLERDFAFMVGELLQQKRLLPDDAQAAWPTVRIRLHDERGDWRQPLPQPETLLRAAPMPGRWLLVPLP